MLLHPIRYLGVMKTLIKVISILLVSTLLACTKADSKKVYFKNLTDGQTVTTPVKIEMGVVGMTVMKAGEVKEGFGHHHLIIDGSAVPTGEVVLKDATHMHFGDGATETTVPLTAGKHTLTLQFADGAHKSYGPEMSTTITVTVQ